jgi:peptidoglycan/xylan/chitin deacetylase (PgdA/CDA1 family)
MKMFIVFFLLANLVYGITYVSFTVDDGYSDHFLFSQILDEYNVSGTFYINSARIDTAPSYQIYLTTSEVIQMYNSGHEIGGHTLSHQNLLQLNYTDQKTQICQDRQKLIDMGVFPTSFAYPFGLDTNVTFRILSECGYNSARDSGGIRTNITCVNCPLAESIPPQNPLQMRSVPYRHTIGVEGLKSYIENASTMENAWLMFIFHELGNYDPATNPGRITVPELREILTYIQNNPHIAVVPVSANINTTFQPMSMNICKETYKYINIGGIDNVTTTTTVTTPPTTTTTKVDEGTPYIVFTFDAGSVDHDVVARLLEQQGMRGVFMVNSDTIGTTGYLSLLELQRLQSYGHEIGSRTKSGANLLNLTTEQQQLEICQDRLKLLSFNLSVSSIAWPYGANNQSVETMAANCGFGWGRDAGGLLTYESCLSCRSTEELPFSTPMKLRSFTVKSSHSLGTLMWQTWRAEERGGSNPRVLIFNFGTICDGCAFKPSVFESFLVWLKTREHHGTKVVTFTQLS